MSNYELVRANGGGPPAVSRRELVRRSRQLAVLEHQTLMRVAGVQADGLVQAEKLREIDHLARTAMSGHALLSQWRDTLAAGDPLLADELNAFAALAKVGKGQVISDTIASMSRESR